MRRWTGFLTRAEWARLAGFGGAVAFLHLLGWGLFLYYARTIPRSPGWARSPTRSACATRSTPTTSPRSTTRRGSSSRRASGRSASASSSRSATRRSSSRSPPPSPSPRKSVNSEIPAFQDYGGYIGASVSGTFLWIIGILNLLVLLDIVRIFCA